MLTACSSRATAYANKKLSRPPPLDQTQPLWRDHIRSAGPPPPRPTSIGTAGRLRSEQVADINRNARPTSSEYAHHQYSTIAYRAQQEPIERGPRAPRPSSLSG